MTKTTLATYLQQPSLKELLPSMENLDRLYNFVKWSLELPEDELIQIPSQDSGTTPKWNEDLVASDILAQLKNRFDRSEPLGFKIPVWVKKKGAHRPEEGGFRVYLQRDPDLALSDIHFIRQNFSVKGVGLFRLRSIRGLVVIDDGPLSTMLGDSEGPAHTEWQKDSLKFRQKYKFGPGVINFVRTSIKEIVKMLQRSTEDVDRTLLQNIFSVQIPDSGTVAGGGKGSRGSGRTPDGEVPPVKRIPPGFHLDKITGGLCLRGDDYNKGPDSVLIVTLAYDVRRGNPFTAYHPMDFDLAKSPVTIQHDGCKITSIMNNTLEITVEKPEFQVCLRGFDTRRDLVIRVDSKVEETGGMEA